MIHSDTIPNDLDLQRTIQKQERVWYILTLFETIWKYREKKVNKVAKVYNLTKFKTI